MTDTSPMRIAVLASGGGSNLQALINHFSGSAASSGTIVLVMSDKSTAGALGRARDAGIATAVVDQPSDGEAILRNLRDANTQLVVLAGYLKLVPEKIIREFRGRIINVHPALLPAFGGPGMYGQRIHKAVLQHGATVTGVTVHFVDEKYDQGPIIAQWPVPVIQGDTPESLGSRVLKTEHALLPLCTQAIAGGKVFLDHTNRVRKCSESERSDWDAQWKYSLEPINANTSVLTVESAILRALPTATQHSEPDT